MRNSLAGTSPGLQQSRPHCLWPGTRASCSLLTRWNGSLGGWGCPRSPCLSRSLHTSSPTGGYQRSHLTLQLRAWCKAAVLGAVTSLPVITADSNSPHWGSVISSVQLRLKKLTWGETWGHAWKLASLKMVNTHWNQVWRKKKNPEDFKMSIGPVLSSMSYIAETKGQLWK